MLLARLRGLIIHIREAPPNCLRCDNAKLRVMDCHPGLRNYECPICFRRYSQRDGGALLHRWLAPITLPLYALVFRQFRICPAVEIADEFHKQKDHAYLKLMVQEIMGELNRPTQQLTICTGKVIPNRNSENSSGVSLQSWRKGRMRVDLETSDKR